MDHAVPLVRAYLQLNGDFTSAECRIVAGAGPSGSRTITDIDILAFRFPSGLPSAPGRKTPQGLDIREVDESLGIPLDWIDMIVGEVKEGKAGIDSGVRDPRLRRAPRGVRRLSSPLRSPAVPHHLPRTRARVSAALRAQALAHAASPSVQGSRVRISDDHGEGAPRWCRRPR